MKKRNRNFKNAAILPRYCYYGNIVVPVRFLHKFLTSYKRAHSFLYPTAVPDAVSDAVFLRSFQRAHICKRLTTELSTISLSLGSQ